MPLRKTRLKICVIGERAVGKTSLIERYLHDRFDEVYRGTLGAQLYSIEADVPSDNGDPVQTRVAIFDMMGEHSVRDHFHDALFHEADAVIAVCDVDRPQTLYAITGWIRVVSLVTSGVPFTIVFNKIDRLADSGIGPTETGWLRDEFPLAPTALTSARTGEGVEQCFSGVIARAVAQKLATSRQRQADRVNRHRILAFIAKRENLGASKTELFGQFRDLSPQDIMEELDHLQSLGLLYSEASGPKTFARSAVLEPIFKFKATSQGQKIAASASLEALTIEEVA